MSIVDDFDLLLSQFNKVAERVFLKQIGDFAENHKEVVIRAYSMLLVETGINIQLKYLVLKSIGELKYKEFTPLIRKLLSREDKVQIIYEAVNSLVRINTLPAYKTIVAFMRENPEAEFIMQVEESLKEFFSKNMLIYHFDVFYRNRGDVKGVEKSSDFLIKDLADGCIKDILPGLSSKYYKIRYETLRVLKHRPNSIFYSPIYNYFKSAAQKVDETFFLQLSEALIANASFSKLGNKIFPTLRKHLEVLRSDKKIIFSIMLLKLNTPAMIGEVKGLYNQLNLDAKLLVFDNLSREDHGCYLDFIRQLAGRESHEALLNRIIEVLIYAKDFAFFFKMLQGERMIRREMLLGILMDFDPPDIAAHVKPFVHASQSNKIVYMAMEYLLRHAADNYFDLVKGVFFSGVSHEIKTLIIRSISKFSSFNRKMFMEKVFKDVKVIHPFKRDFLFSLLGVLNEKKFEKSFEEMILNRVLILMEEAGNDEIVDFVYFFDKYDVNSLKDMELINDELRLIQNTILKSGGKDDMVRMIHILIKNIEKRVKQNLRGKDGVL
ncbi:MAG: hypothetical protein GY950_00340 [bacterium]|nr:hypothetical protein [bacterium]